MSTIFFAIFAVIALLSAAGTIASTTPIRAALSLLAHILSLACLYISLYAHLLGAIQLIVYAGAVVVLFVFVIMLIGPTDDEGPTLNTGGGIARILSICIMTGVTLSIASAVGGVMPEAPLVEACAGGVAECSQYGGVRAIADVLYKDAALPFELISLLLLVAIIGAIAVARGRSLHESKRKKDADLVGQIAASSGE